MNMDRLIDIGPECFADGDFEVICYKGENYYKACGEVVRVIEKDGLDPGGHSTCVKRFGHQGGLHQDYDGNMVYKAKEDTDGASG